jgi:hypothetical protein
MELPALLDSFNVAEASKGLECRLWIDRNLKANWRAKLLVLMDFSNRAEASEGVGVILAPFQWTLSLMPEEFA